MDAILYTHSSLFSAEASRENRWGGGVWAKEEGRMKTREASARSHTRRYDKPGEAILMADEVKGV